MKHLYSLLLLCLVALSCSRCKEECDDPTNPDCPNYVAPDPCANSREVSAEFVIEEMYDASPPSFQEVQNVVCDHSVQPGSITGTSLIRVRPKQEGLNCTWILGSDTIHSSEYSFVFPASLCAGTYPITLITSGNPDSTCFPNDNGQDTVTRFVQLYPFEDQEIWGKYRVADVTNPTDSFDVSIRMEFFQGVMAVHLYLKGFAPGNERDSCWYTSSSYAYNFIKVHSDNGACGQVSGEFWINSENQLEADYSYSLNTGSAGNSEYTEFTRRVRGRKIH